MVLHSPKDQAEGFALRVGVGFGVGVTGGALGMLGTSTMMLHARARLPQSVNPVR